MGYQPFVINARTITFRTMSRTEIKHIPHKTSPHIRTFVYYFPILNVIFCLPILWMPPTSGNSLYQ